MAGIPHTKLVIRGQYAGTSEEWSIGHKFSKYLGVDYLQAGIAGGPVPNPAPPLDQTANIDLINEAQLKAAVGAFFGTAMFSSHVWVREVRAYHIGPDGKTVGNPRWFDWTGTEVKGTGTSVVYPPQTALVVTTAAANRGNARYGRFYLPMINVPLEPDLRIHVNQAVTIGAASTAYLKALSRAFVIPNGLPHPTPVNISMLGQGRQQPITRIRVGRVLDTVRTRRRQLEEAYQDTDLLEWQS